MADETDPLEPYYRAARESAREIVTLIKVAQEHGTDLEGHEIRGQIRQKVRTNTDLQTWLLIDVLARGLAATYEDLDDWSNAVLQALAQEGGDL